jgi:hypothetical protein
MYKPDSTHEGKPSAVSSHDFEDECTRMRDGSRMDVVYSLADSMQRSWRADCKIGQGHIVIYGSNKAHDPEVPVARNLLIRDTIWPASMEITSFPRE